MTYMYHNFRSFAYPYYLNTAVPNHNLMMREPGDYQQLIGAILAGIKGEATAIDFYSRLVDEAPNEKHKADILHALEDEKIHLKQFTEIYITLTGNQPAYKIKKVKFDSYYEGLQKAYEDELEAYEEYRDNYLLTQNPPVRDVFLRAFTDEIEHATRFGYLMYAQPATRTKKPTRADFTDYGKEPFVVNINEATKQNDTFRTAIWTGDYLQVTLMSIGVGDDIGLEIHPNTDQFLRVEDGQGLVRMGDSNNNLTFEQKVEDDFAIMIPAGKWHNLINTGDKPLKLYSIYAPPEHPFGTVHGTKEDAMAADEHH